jgi:hypothetical protein
MRPRTAGVEEQSNADFESYLVAYSKQIETEIKKLMASNIDPV